MAEVNWIRKRMIQGAFETTLLYWRTTSTALDEDTARGTRPRHPWMSCDIQSAPKNTDRWRRATL